MFEQQESKFIVAVILSNIFILSIQAFKELVIWYGNPTVLGLLSTIVPLNAINGYIVPSNPIASSRGGVIVPINATIQSGLGGAPEKNPLDIILCSAPNPRDINV